MKDGTTKLTRLVLGLGAPVVIVAITWGAVAVTVAMSSDAVGEIERVPGPARTAAADPSPCDEPQGTVPTEETLLDLVRPLPPDVEVRKWVVGSGGAVAGSGDLTSRLVYSNTLGKSVFGPLNANTSFADDLTTTGVNGCLLDRYVIRVSGDARGDGSGVGPYAVDVALYETCPGTSDEPVPIAGTTAHVDLPDNGTYDVEILISADVEVPLPSSMHIGVSFDRLRSGIVVGAPAMLGFSADRFDYPGFACVAGLGGFPEAPHASVYAQIYVRGECEDSFVAYRNSNHAGRAFSAGSRVYFAQQIHLPVDRCDMVAYEVVHKGNGFFMVDLYTFLSEEDPRIGCFPSDSRVDCFSSGDDPQVCRRGFDPPLPLVTPAPWVVFKSSSAVVGPILTCKQADLGTTENEYRYYLDGEWLYGGLSGPCWSGFDITIYCDGHPPLGACCDMVLTDDEGESVCRDDLAEMNCPFPTLWKKDTSCGSVCVGGSHDGEACTRQTDCPGGDCPGPFLHPCGVSACCQPDWECKNLTENQCNQVPPVEAPRIYDRGEFCAEQGHRCLIPACVGREGDCCSRAPCYCVGGEDDGERCDLTMPPDFFCPGHSCTGGSQDGELCDPDDVDACPGGSCTPARCVLGVGCEDPYCCTEVCSSPYNVFCCTTYWDDDCASAAARLCTCARSHDECWSPDWRQSAQLISIPEDMEVDGIHATTSETDPGFCCHEEEPGAQGVGTVWYKFVAPPNGECEGGTRDGWFCDPNAEDPDNTADGCPGGTCRALPVSVHLDTCCSNSSEGAPADDSLLQVFAVADPDRGLCDDGLTVCSVSAQDCYAGSDCIFDERWACANLMPIACSDDAGPSCVCGPVQKEHNSKLCIPNLNPGELYYVMIAAKSDEHRGIWRLRIVSPCSPDLPPPHNDLCMNAEQLTGTHAEVPFDLSGEAFGEAPATLDCPGPPPFPVCTNTMKVDLWYDWIAPCNGKVTVHTCGFDEFGQGSDGLTPDTSLVVYDSCDCPAALPMEQREGVLACNDFQPSPCFLGSKLTDLEVEEGRCYKIRLGGSVDDPYTSILEGSLKIDFTAVECPAGQVMFRDPPSGVVDARQPHPPSDPLDLQGVDTLLVEAPAGAYGPECWSLCETASSGEPNNITSVIDNGDGTLAIYLVRPITTGAVTTITYTDNDGGEQTGVFTAHPGDVNGDGRTSPADILFLIDCFNGIRFCEIWQTDIDHSGVTGPPDIISLVDLLNGAGEFDAWLNRPLPWPDGCEP